MSAEDGSGNRFRINGKNSGIALTPFDTGYRVAQLMVVFKLPQSDTRFQSLHLMHLAFIEWFSPFRRSPSSIPTHSTDALGKRSDAFSKN